MFLCRGEVPLLDGEWQDSCRLNPAILTDAPAALTILSPIARVAELADARDSKSRVPLGRVGSTPTSGSRKPPVSGGFVIRDAASIDR